MTLWDIWEMISWTIFMGIWSSDPDSCQELQIPLLYSFHNFRNRSKGGAFLPTHLACLLAKTSLDCVSRLLLFSTWMYVLNEGQFSTGMTVGAYYATFTLLLTFHAFFNKNLNFWSAKNLIGMYIYLSLTIKIFSLKYEILSHRKQKV